MSEKIPTVLDRTITARFYVAEVTKRPAGNATVVLMPAYANGANHEWSKATPSGRFEMSVTNPDAIAFYEAALGLPMDECIEIGFRVVPSTPRPE